MQDCHMLAEKNNGFCLAQEYVGSKCKIKWQCSKGHVFMARYNDVQQGHWCPICGREKALKKNRETCIKKYGVPFAIQNPSIFAAYKKTCIERYGVDNPSKVKEHIQKAARKRNKAFEVEHWNTGEALVCIGGWELAVVRFLNERRIDFKWQSKTFHMPDGRTYTPDLYLVDKNKWVEIKGRFYDDAKEKWEWFCGECSNSELWNKDRLVELGVL